MPNKRNIELYKQVKEIYQNFGKNMIFVDFTGVNVESTNLMRKEIKKRGGVYKVVKNTIGYKFLKEDVGLDIPEIFAGVNGIVFADDNSFFEVLRYLVKLEKDTKVKLKNSLFENRVYDREATLNLSKLPSKSEIIGYVIGAISGGIYSFVHTVNNIAQSFVSVLKAIEDKK